LKSNVDEHSEIINFFDFFIIKNRFYRLGHIIQKCFKINL
jgi:hypothetical protein